MVNKTQVNGTHEYQNRHSDETYHAPASLAVAHDSQQVPLGSVRLDAKGCPSRLNQLGVSLIQLGLKDVPSALRIDSGSSFKIKLFFERNYLFARTIALLGQLIQPRRERYSLRPIVNFFAHQLIRLI